MCEDGFVLDTDSDICIKRENCGCRHGGQRHVEGSIIKKSCNTCTCRNGNWKCTEDVCPGTCFTWGQSHYKTFDGKMFDFIGDCEYMLVKGDHPQGSFEVTVKNVPCGSKDATCSKAFTVRVFQRKSEESLLPEEKISLTRDEPIPKTAPNSRIMVIESGFHVIVETDVGLLIYWDRVTALHIKVKPEWMKQTKGLCGNFNNDQHDDFLGPSDGIPEARVSSFVNSWKIFENCPSAQSPPDACVLHPERESWARQKCRILENKPFSACHSAVRLEPYYERCIFDSCSCDLGGDCDCFCSAIAAYVQECNEWGIHIKWRSQDLCPMQCEDCGIYDSCVALCPQETCDTQVLSPRIEQMCSWGLQDTCVEGCTPKPCPKGFIYNNSRQYKCIPEKECNVVCLIIDDIAYYEDQRIPPAQAGDKCQECHCRRGKIDCIGDPCPPPTEFPKRPSIACKTGWTPWRKRNIAPSLDYERYNSLRFHCDLKNMKELECKQIGSSLTKPCDLPKDLICLTGMQDVEACQEYQIRAYCQCEEETTMSMTTEIITSPIPGCKPGWTKYFNIDHPNIESPDSRFGDDKETIERIIEIHGEFCLGGVLEQAECATRLKNGTYIDYKESYATKVRKNANHWGLKCNTKHGFECVSAYLPPKLRKIKCLDFEIRFLCVCVTSSTSPGIIPTEKVTTMSSTRTETTITSTKATTVSVCPPEQVYDVCAYKCDRMCPPFVDTFEECRLDPNHCFEGCRPDCPPPMMWRNYSDCVPKEKCPCLVKPEGTVLLPKDVIELECLKCQCLQSRLDCKEIPNCGVATTTEISTAHPTSPPPRINITLNNCSTEWVNIDKPTTGAGDFETINEIRRYFIFCDNPIKIYCRNAVTKESVSDAYRQKVNCDIEYGFRCLNEENSPEGCDDYEISFFCPCPTTAPTTVTPVPTMPIVPCEVSGFTEWYNSHSPDDFEEHETIQDARGLASFCADHEITAIQCRGTGRKDTTIQEGAECSLSRGLWCQNEKLTVSERCWDYEVRFFCDCPITTLSPKITKFSTPMIISSTTPIPKACAYWSEWINDRKPGPSKSGVKGIKMLRNDFERKTAADFSQIHFCTEGEINKIECVESSTNLDYTKSGGNNLVCSLDYGFRCKGQKQPKKICKDYKIRYYCDCVTTTKKFIVTSPTPPPVFVPRCPEDNQFYLIDGDEPIGPHKFKATSSKDSIINGPQNAKFSSGSAWIASGKSNQSLEIDLGKVQRVYGIITKGDAASQSHVKSFRIAYSKDGSVYYTISDPSFPDVAKIFIGNFDGDSAVSNWFDPSFEARFIKILPLEFQTDIALRVDLIGCKGGIPPVIEGKKCDESMGMENGLITKYQIKTSSDKNQKSLGRYGRLNMLQTEDHNGGWVSAQLDQQQYIQINFYAPRVLTGIVTQGRHASPQWVTHYSVWFSQDEKNWIPITSRLDEGLQTKIFPANRDSDTPVKNVFPINIKAQYIRIIPLAWHNWIALRLEVLGCYEEPPKMTPIVYEKTSPTPTIPYGVPLDCYQPMGLSNRSLPDVLIKVSSSKSEVSKIRLDSHADAGSPGAWVAAPNDHRRTIIIDLTGLRNLTGIVTQGREDADMWVTAYTVEYSTDGTNWEDAVDKEKNSVIFEGNRDRSSRVLRIFKNMVEARYVKITIVKYHERPAIRFELYGCFEGYNICTKTGPWLVASQHREGEIMPMPEIIKKSGLCTNPFEIQCQIAAKHKDYTEGNQTMVCNLEKGLRCLHADQINKLCYLYQVRIKCLCPETPVTPPSTKAIPLTVCPELPDDIKHDCPPYCQEGYACDGEKCVSSESCPCYIGHKPFNTSFNPHTSECKVCTCTLGGHSSCVSKMCPPCSEDQKSVINNATCECECIPCPDGYVLCPTDGICIKKEEWCDEIAHCQDDEIYCPKETTSVPSTLIPPPRPKCQPPLCECSQSVCKMVGNNFKTFDGAEYLYDKICNHILMKDYANESYYVTVHRTFTMGNLCRRSLTIKAGDILVTFGPGDKEVTVQSQPVSVSNFGAVSKRFKTIRLEKNGHKIIFISKDYNFKVIWNALQDVEIDITCGPHLVYGLCGYRNGNEIQTIEDDLTMPDGTMASIIEEFGNSYRIGSRVCCDGAQCPNHLKTISSNVCNKLLQEPFKQCVSYMSIESEYYVCMQHMCDCLQENQEDIVVSEQNCKCRAYESFIDACTSDSVAILQLKSTWRAAHGCSVKCPPGQYYQECGYEVTCDNYKEERSSCSSGCFCPPGFVVHHNRCVEQKMCQDCICMGYGDPNYYSFRETYIPFQGLCTYVLAQHNLANQEHLNFMVLGTNVECPEEPKTSCLESIEVVWNGHSVLKTKDLSVVFDGQVLTSLPYVAHGISVTSYGKDETIIHIAEIQLTVRYHDSNYGFRIETSSYYYFNNTVGLCGECDFTESEYLTTSSGVLTMNATEFGYSWLVETQDLSKCILIPPPPKEVEPSVCNFTSNACDVVKDTSIYMTPCKHDIGYSKNIVKSICRAKIQFAKDCCELGVSLKDWLMESDCIEDICSEDMVYSCASACFKTCDNYKSYDPDDCDFMPVLGCSCPPGTVWHLGRCSEERICQICDSDGHVIGDQWKKDPCTICECLPDLNVHCTIDTCSLPPNCLSNETLVEFKANNETCCSSYSCMPPPIVPCPEVQEPDCEPGETLTVKYEDNCPFPVCECRVEMCPDVFKPFSLHPSEVYELVTKTCCKEYHLVCNFSLCEEPLQCKLGLELSSTEGKCCSTYKCVKKEKICVYQHKYQIVDGFGEKLPLEKAYQVEYTVGNSWNDGLCISCDCQETTTNCIYTPCYNISESPEAEKYYYEEEFLPYQCCPIHIAKFCVANGVKYKINDTWVSTEDKCKSYRCADAGNGKLTWEENESKCITECPANAIYVPPPEQSLLCCGLCKNLTCEENGLLHQIDETWESDSDPCIIHECVREGLEAIIIARKRECPELQENCPQEFIVTKECCRQCKLPPGYCSAIKMTFSETLDFFRLPGKNGISCFLNESLENIKKCEGQCQEITFSPNTNIFENVCGCCLPKGQVERQIILDCTDGSKLLTLYQEPISCQCTSCSGGQDLKLLEAV